MKMVIYAGFRFLFELLTIFVLGYSGFQLHALKGWRFVLGIGAAVIVVVIWGIWGAPSSAHRLTGDAHTILELSIYIAAGTALFFTGHKWPALIFTIVGVANAIFHNFHQEI